MGNIFIPVLGVNMFPMCRLLVGNIGFEPWQFERSEALKPLFEFL